MPRVRDVILDLKIVGVGRPVGALVTAVVHRAAAAQRNRSRPQRIIGTGKQYFVTIVEQPLHGHHDELRYAIADVNVVHFDVRDPLLLSVLHHGFARRVESLGVAITLRVRQVVDDVDEDLLRRFEAERRRVADVQLHDPVAFLFEAVGFGKHRPANVVTDVGELIRLGDRRMPAAQPGHVVGNVCVLHWHLPTVESARY